MKTSGINNILGLAGNLIINATSKPFTLCDQGRICPHN